jgi:hypothetical protein
MSGGLLVSLYRNLGLLSTTLIRLPLDGSATCHGTHAQNRPDSCANPSRQVERSP